MEYDELLMTHIEIVDAANKVLTGEIPGAISSLEKQLEVLRELIKEFKEKQRTKDADRTDTRGEF